MRCVNTWPIQLSTAPGQCCLNIVQVERGGFSVKAGVLLRSLCE